MPNIESIQSISQNFTVKAPEETAFITTIDLQILHSQLHFLPETSHHCNFNLVRGDVTGSYTFKE